MARARKAVDPAECFERVGDAVRAFPLARYLLAVSGGRDSMVLLDAFSRYRSDAVGVATFDHGTGPAAERAVRLVEREAHRRSIRVVTGRRAPGGAVSEAAWRRSRWAFLAGTARDLGAVVVTAHSRDDQLETVVIRALRDPRHTSVRGLAAMYARSAVARPLIDVSRADIAQYAARNGVRFVEDPSNASRAHLRNRVRLDLLPALERGTPGFGDALIRISRRAAAWRDSVEEIVDSLGVTTGSSVVVPAAAMAALTPEGLAVVWPPIAARAGLALDWRGTERLVAFTKTGRPGGRIPLSGGAQVERTGGTFVVRAVSGDDALYSTI